MMFVDILLLLLIVGICGAFGKAILGIPDK